MNKKTFITALLALVSMTGQSQTDSTAVKNDSVTWSQTLDGVTVKAQRQLIKQEVDRIGYDVQADEDAKTQMLMDMLRKVPMVTIDGEDNIKVKGNANFKIYKNGHLDPSLTKNAKEIFKAIPASSVKRIEVITDPGAREDAEGVDAILNIVMVDTRQMEGVTGSVSGSYGTLNNPNLGAYLTTQFGKAIVSADYGYFHMSKKSSTTNSYMERTFVESGNTQKIRSESSNPGDIHFADINASYDIDTLNLLSASFGGYFYKIDVQGGGPVSMFNALGNSLYSYTENYRLPSYNHNSWNGRLDYEHRTRRKGELFTLSYMLALTRQHSEQEDTYTDMQNTPFNYTGLIAGTREHFTEHTFQADYIRPLWEGHKLEVGVKYIDRRNSSNNHQEYYNSTIPSTSTAFDHSAQIAAAYTDYIYNKDKWSARAGLRYEYSYLKGSYPDGSAATFDKHLNDWVPQASVKYQINDSQSLKLGYTTSITRPGITYLNPAVVSMPTSVSYGMPQLVSTRQQTLSLTYMYVGKKLTLQFVPHYSYYHNGIGSLVYTQGDVRYSTYGNNLKQHRWQMEGYVQWKPFDGTTLVANLNFTEVSPSGEQRGVIPAGTPFIIKWDNKGTTIEEPEFTSVTISSATTNNEQAFLGGSFKGSFSPVSFTANDKTKLFLGAGNNLHWPSADMTLGACRAYFDLGTSNASEFVLNFGDGENVTGVNEVIEVNEDNDNSWYTLSGTRLEGKPTQKGLYIHGNKKIVVK